MIRFSVSDEIVYLKIKNLSKCSFEELIENIDLDVDSIRRSIEFLKSENLISENIFFSNIYNLEKIGLESLKKGFIEEILCDFLINKNINISSLKEININNLNIQEIILAFGVCKKDNLINIKDSIIVPVLDYKEKIKEKKEKLLLISENKEVSDKYIDYFLKRNFISKKQITKKNYAFLKNTDYILDSDTILNLDSDSLKNKSYKNKIFKEFEVEKLPKPKDAGRIHPLRQILYYIRDLYLEMGFKEMKSPYVDLSFWSMDSMFISQDHPMRDLQDTFFLPLNGKLPKDSSFLKKIKDVHENGSKTNSLGHRYLWDIDISKQLILRTHTTASTFRKFLELSEDEKQNSKYFSIGKVFRNETIDGTHLPEFHQAEGFVIGDNISLSDLIGFIKVFLKKLGIEKIKIKPTYNPYTEPSIEVFAFFEEKNSWVEIMNSGIFRKECLFPYGIKNNVIAWGIGIERIAMLLYNKTNIKEIYGDENDIDWLRKYSIPPRRLI
ncbi:MAG: phenylalanine--tRNA ligase subunit alpha [Candidatus ainarchaeum sp.]|nr:phenylalanine--tRNA ligase subunit alpha [Candidatus ainarchaeum sp.]MDD3975636.1 phenylalanine--tRNA ligase subunit alpha [Candidatus ainarchaeum sp.]